MTQQEKIKKKILRWWKEYINMPVRDIDEQEKKLIKILNERKNEK